MAATLAGTGFDSEPYKGIRTAGQPLAVGQTICLPPAKICRIGDLPDDAVRKLPAANDAVRLRSVR
jgi:hypothetical protein